MFTENMLFELEVTAEANSPMEVDRVFDLLDEPKPVRQVFTSNLLGEDVWCDVTGWEEAGPCPAYVALAEDSGDGVILLLYGGDQGIRLKSIDCLEQWNLGSSNQWGEPCLMLGNDTPYRE